MGIFGNNCLNTSWTSVSTRINGGIEKIGAKEVGGGVCGCVGTFVIPFVALDVVVKIFVVVVANAVVLLLAVVFGKPVTEDCTLVIVLLSGSIVCAKIALIKWYN